MTPTEVLRYLQREHRCETYPVAHCRKCRTNWRCDVIRAIDSATEAERERVLSVADGLAEVITRAEGGDAEYVSLGKLRKALSQGGGRA